MTVVSVSGQVSALPTIVVSLGLTSDFQARLEGQLMTAQSDLRKSRSKCAAICKPSSTMRKAQYGRHLTVTQARQLVAASKTVQETLGC
jgi:hypothetical protein